MSDRSKNSRRWYENAIFYEIFVRSFKDGNDDGIGDLEGIISKADYLEWLGVTALWLTPINKSSGFDYGYDVSDYFSIDPLFGDLNVFDRMVKALHEKGIKVVLDLVVNHTGTTHLWFEESRSSLDNPKRDWYIWRPGRPGGLPPNNWRNISTGSSGWTFDSETGEYYFHQFRESQPDLNWRNPEVRHAVANIMKFWVERGVDGFRIDAIDHFLEDEEFRDDPVLPPHPDRPFGGTYYDLDHIHTRNQPGMSDLMKFFSDTAESLGDVFILYESYVDFPEILVFYENLPHANCAPTIYSLVEKEKNSWKNIVTSLELNLPASHLRVYAHGNHDISRLATRMKDTDLFLAATLLFTLPGSPFIYYGEEIGMKNFIPSHDNAKDFPIFSRNVMRTPMQWDDSENASFSKTKSWLPASSDKNLVNVDFEKRDNKSLLLLYKRLIALRKSEPVIVSGVYENIETNNKDIHCFYRKLKLETVLVCLNWSKEEFILPLNKYSKLLLSTMVERKDVPQKIAPGEGVVIKLV